MIIQPWSSSWLRAHVTITCVPPISQLYRHKGSDRRSRIEAKGRVLPLLQHHLLRLRALLPRLLPVIHIHCPIGHQLRRRWRSVERRQERNCHVPIGRGSADLQGSRGPPLQPAGLPRVPPDARFTPNWVGHGCSRWVINLLSNLWFCRICRSRVRKKGGLRGCIYRQEMRRKQYYTHVAFVGSTKSQSWLRYYYIIFTE